MFTSASDPARLPFAWWNTKVAPPSRASKANASHISAVIDVVRMLVQQQGCLIMALAEVRRQNVLGWIPSGVRADWNVLADTSGHHHDFDVAVIFDHTWLHLMDHHWVTAHHAGQMVRAGLVATFAFADGSGWIIVAAAHWRSDMWNASDAKARRTVAAMALRGAIAVALQDVGPDVPVLILGDFNAEPFDEQFSASLPTARSRAEVQRHRPRRPSDLLFYNAAWRWLGERYPWDSGQQTPTLAGTYRLEGSRVPTTWRTFDQVLVSPSLLGDAAWSLDERVLGICDDTCVYDGVGTRPRAPFDHLPIVGHLQRSAFTATATATGGAR